MIEGAVNVLGVTVNDGGIELIVTSDAEARKGIGVAHSYFVEFRGERFGQRARDVLTELEELAYDVHVGWKREPKEEHGE